MKKILIVSETIFSDRLFKTLGLAEATKFSVSFISSEKLFNLELDYFRTSQRPLSLRVIKLLKLIHKYVAPHGSDNSSLKDHFKIDSKNWSFLKVKLLQFLIFAYSHSGLIRDMSIFFLYNLTPSISEEFEQSIEEFDSVFFFSTGNLKQFLLLPIYKHFKKRDLFTFCYIQSWDNPTSKGYALFRPDHTFTWTELMRKELVQYMDFKLEKTSAIGTPIFKNRKLDKNKNKHILFATKSPKTYPHNSEVAEIIAKTIHNKDIEFTVRIHPLAISQNFLSESERIIELSQRYNFNILMPVAKSNILLNQDYDEDVEKNFIKSTLFISVFSTMNLESAHAGIETLNIDFDGIDANKFSSRQDISYDRRQVHNQRALKYNYIKNIKSKDELVSAVNQHILADLEKDEPFREELIRNECSPFFKKKDLENNIIKFIV